MYDYDYNDYGYDYSNSYTTTDWGNSYTTIDNPALDQVYAILPVIGIVSLVLGLLMLISIWKIFKKAGKHGWASIVPIYNFIVLIEVAGLPLWYFILFLIPFVNIYAYFKIHIEIAHKFGKGTGFGVLSVFFPIICLPMLAFGKCKYEGNDNNTNTIIVSTDNNTDVNQAQFQNMVSNNEVQESSVNNSEFNPKPVVPSFIPTNDVSNNMQNGNTMTDNNASVNNMGVNTLTNNNSNVQDIMWKVNSPIDNNQVVESNNLNVINSMENNFSNMNETVTNNINNSVVDNNTISNTSEMVVPEIPSIGIVPNVNTVDNNVAPVVNPIEESAISDNQNNVIPSIEEVDSNPGNEVIPPINDINNIPINNVEETNVLPSNNNTVVEEVNINNNHVNNIPVNNEEQNVIPEMHSIPNIPVIDNNKKNISYTMSLNELLAEINIDEQK